MSKPYKEIAPISPENREAIRRKTAYSLPDEPSARGMPPDQIRKYFWSALAGDRQSLFVEIDRVAKETNAAIDALLILIFGTVEVDGAAVRIAELIPTGISDYSLADLLAGFVDGSAQQLISSGVGDMSMAEYLALLDQKIEEGGGGGGIAEETDPTVPAWAKKPSKPTYTASEVGARPDTWMPTYTDVGAEKSGAAASAVSGHNTSTAAHSDLRQLIDGLAARLNAFANSTDEDLDQAQEFMLYIKANRDLISQITTSKVSVADIVNNLTTNLTNKPLSAAQGVALKALIDAITVPTKVSQLENDAKYLTGFTESDPTVPAWAKEKTKPSYNKSEVGLGNVDNVKQYSATNPPPYPVASVNGKTGALTLAAADVGAHPNTWMPSAADVGARPNTWMPTYTDVGADKSGAAASAVSGHNTNTDAHNDIRLLVQGLADRLNAFANSTDEDLDTAQEFMLYIKANRDLISQITTSKVSVADIVNNLTTNVTNKPLSAAQGVALKALIDALDTGTAGADSVPDYWIDELDAKADAIQAAMEKAGRNKSAFLWYTDAHWVNGNSKVSPKLLNYLYMHTPMNKVNFGGDIIGDTLLATREEMKYLYEWRKAIKDLPNHHSVFGNHDMLNLDTVDYEDDNYRYAFLLAPEESYDKVWGDGNYYYIDNPAEKTRYLYICYPNTDTTWLLTQTQFIADSLKSTPEGWHIVAIAHRWWQYSSSSTPTVGSIPGFEKDMLSVFDAYNARTTRSGSNYFYAQDFTDAKGKVEFCIGGHIHVDYDFESAGGIPIIITTSDTNQNRVPDSTVDSGTVGTTTEAAVYGIIADYNDATNPKITVVGVGRGTSRVVRSSGVKATSISDITYSGDTTVGAIIDKSKFSFTVNYSNGATDTITGATSVSPATIGVVGDNAVTITYTEGAATLTASATIVGTPVPVVNLLNLDRTYVAGTAGETLGTSHLDESKAYTNLVYGNKTFNASSNTASEITENSVTVKESGVGGITVAYPIHLTDILTTDYKITFDYSGAGKCRTYWFLAKSDGTLTSSKAIYQNNTSGASGSADVVIKASDIGVSATEVGWEWLIIMLGSNTSGTKAYSNVSLTEA